MRLKKDITTIDIKGVCLCTTINKFIVVKLTDEQVEIMCKIDGMRDKYVTYKKERKVMYLMFNSGLYSKL